MARNWVWSSAQCFGIDSAEDGKAIIAIGNPDTADNVLTYVPGTGSGLSNIDGNVDRTKTMVDDANALGSGDQTSGILWLGYAPHMNAPPHHTMLCWDTP